MKTTTTIIAAFIFLLGFTANAQNETLIAANNANAVVFAKKMEATVLSNTQMREMQLNDLSLVVLDARNRDAFNIGTIKQAKFIGDDISIEKIWMLSRDASVVIFGNDIKKNKEISSMLLEKGFSKVYFLHGTLSGLANQGISIKGNAAKSDRKAKSSK